MPGLLLPASSTPLAMSATVSVVYFIAPLGAFTEQSPPPLTAGWVRATREQVSLVDGGGGELRFNVPLYESATLFAMALGESTLVAGMAASNATVTTVSAASSSSTTITLNGLGTPDPLSSTTSTSQSPLWIFVTSTPYLPSPPVSVSVTIAQPVPSGTVILCVAILVVLWLVFLIALCVRAIAFATLPKEEAAADGWQLGSRPRGRVRLMTHVVEYLAGSLSDVLVFATDIAVLSKCISSPSLNPLFQAGWVLIVAAFIGVLFFRGRFARNSARMERYYYQFVPLMNVGTVFHWRLKDFARTETARAYWSGAVRVVSDGFMLLLLLLLANNQPRRFNDVVLVKIIVCLVHIAFGFRGVFIFLACFVAWILRSFFDVDIAPVETEVGEEEGVVMVDALNEAPPPSSGGGVAVVNVDPPDAAAVEHIEDDAIPLRSDGEPRQRRAGRRHTGGGRRLPSGRRYDEESDTSSTPSPPRGTRRRRRGGKPTTTSSSSSRTASSSSSDSYHSSDYSAERPTSSDGSFDADGPHPRHHRRQDPSHQHRSGAEGYHAEGGRGGNGLRRLLSESPPPVRALDYAEEEGDPRPPFRRRSRRDPAHNEGSRRRPDDAPVEGRRHKARGEGAAHPSHGDPFADDHDDRRRRRRRSGSHRRSFRREVLPDDSGSSAKEATGTQGIIARKGHSVEQGVVVAGGVQSQRPRRRRPVRSFLLLCDIVAFDDYDLPVPPHWSDDPEATVTLATGSAPSVVPVGTVTTTTATVAAPVTSAPHPATVPAAPAAASSVTTAPAAAVVAAESHHSRTGSGTTPAVSGGAARVVVMGAARPAHVPAIASSTAPTSPQDLAASASGSAFHRPPLTPQLGATTTSHPSSFAGSNTANPPNSTQPPTPMKQPTAGATVVPTAATARSHGGGGGSPAALRRHDGSRFEVAEKRSASTSSASDAGGNAGGPPARALDTTAPPVVEAPPAARSHHHRPQQVMTTTTSSSSLKRELQLLTRAEDLGTDGAAIAAVSTSSSPPHGDGVGSDAAASPGLLRML